MWINSIFTLYLILSFCICEFGIIIYFLPTFVCFQRPHKTPRQYLVSIWLFRLWWTWFLLKVMADWLYIINFIALGSSLFISLINQFIHSPWQSTTVAAIYWASHEDNSAMFCFWDVQLSNLLLRKTMWPEVLFQSLTSPQSHCHLSQLSQNYGYYVVTTWGKYQLCQN